jgi:hypothetical protein
MGKGARKTRTKDGAERKLERARQKFEATQEQYLLVREEGKQRVEQARLEADRKLTKLHEQLEKRAQQLVRAEERALAFGLGKGAGAPESVGTLAAASNTPERAYDAAQQLQAEQRGPMDGAGLALPDGA